MYAVIYVITTTGKAKLHFHMITLFSITINCKNKINVELKSVATDLYFTCH